ncbi:hypothetical protein [Brevibacterium paucivorans]|uniref:Gram-positive cocci surface proteins LPxTG domain-containing protein n=2 Tax=Brevibacterium TaxID=1696 RepID=A0A2N6VK88_9MICO|nr:hypothetical protein [Brevibacterium paucivorans]PMD04560.1 hypothetical protein CJ199_11135 [Brevibacterium paucivorans]
MKKLVLAPAVALVAGAIAFSGTPAFAAPTAECSNNTLNAKQGAQCTITLDADKVQAQKVSISVSNLPAGAKIKSVDAPNSADPSLKLVTRVDELAETPTFEVYGVDGVTGGGDGVKNPNGDYTVTVTLEDGTKVNAGVIRYIDKDKEAAGDPELSAQFDKYHVGAFRAAGMVVSYKNLESSKEFTWVLKHEESGKTSTGTFNSNSVSKNGGTFYAKVEGADKMSDSELKGKYTLTLKDESGKTLDASISFAVVDDREDVGTPQPNNPKPGEGDKPKEEAAKYALKVSPKEVTPGDFVKKDKGVKLVVTGLKPNEKFTYSVSKQAGNGKVETLFNDVQANKDGVWAYTVYGREAGAGLQGFVGTYKVTVKSEEGVLTDSFKVTNTPGKKDEAKPGDKGDGKDKGDAKGGDNNSGKGDAKNTGDNSGKSNNAKGNGKSSNTLPRTGMELSGLVAGGVLLTVGAATVLVTRRRTK